MEQDLSRWQRARYRVAQFLRGWRARLAEDDRQLVAGVLTPAALALFDRMPLDAQVHSVRVLRTLQAEGVTSTDLATAALLHDVGKVAAADAGAYLGLWLRGPMVLLEAFAPMWLERLASPQPSPSPRYALYVQLAHAQIGAAWARTAGCSDLACWLIEHHQDKFAGARVGAASGEGRGFDVSSAERAASLAPFSTATDTMADETIGQKERENAPRPSPLVPDIDAATLLTRLQWADGRN